MATKLDKAVHRETYSTIRDRSKTRTLIASFVPGDVVTVRPKGTRKGFSVSIAAVYQYAGKLEGDRIRREKAAAKKGK